MSMETSGEHKKVFATVGFRPEADVGNLKAIEIVGIPAEELPRGEVKIAARTQDFFDSLIVSPLFKKSQLLRSDFSYLKIWLYHKDMQSENKGYSFPELDSKDLKIESPISFSSLRAIYVLDNGLAGKEYFHWKKQCENLFSNLFRDFVTAPEGKKVPGNNSAAKFINKLRDRIDAAVDAKDKYRTLKQNLFFDTLIIQID